MTLKKITVNGEEVEYFHITEKPDGSKEITFTKKFNIVDAHMSEIMKRVRENGLKCHVFKDIPKGIISILLYSIDDLPGILHSLDIPNGVYEVYYEDCLVVVDIPRLHDAVHVKNITGVGVI